MPLCSCGEWFSGPGTRCLQHRSTRRTYNYNSDSTDPSSINRHMGAHARRRRAHFVDDHETQGHQHGLLRYRSHGNGYGSDAQSNDLAQSVIEVLTTSSNTHAIAVAEYSVNPSTGTCSFRAQANLDCEQCTVCRQWFPNRYQLECHQQEFPVGCEECRICLRRDSVAWHADTRKHERCFVRDCPSGFRRFGKWKSRFVKGHILESHYRGY